MLVFNMYFICKPAKYKLPNSEICICRFYWYNNKMKLKKIIIIIVIIIIIIIITLFMVGLKKDSSNLN